MAVGPYGALLEAVRGVRWPARRAVAGGAPGAHLARTRGVASEFVEYRPYRQGDDPRRLDWKLLARSDRAFIRLAPDRAVIATLVAVDASASMNFPAVTRFSKDSSAEDGANKWSCAKRLAVACAAVAHSGADPVGLTVAGDGALTRLAPRTRRGVVAEVARTLDAIAPRGTGALAESFVGAPARVLVITDCLGDFEALRRACRAHVANGGEVHVVHVVSRRELEPAGGAMLATDPEDGTIARPLTDDTREAYRSAFRQWRETVSRAWRDDGVAYQEVVDDEPADTVVRRIVAVPGGAA